MSAVQIRPAALEDLDWICEQGVEFNQRHRSLWPGFPYAGAYDKKSWAENGFGPQRVFETLVAWKDETRLGYACYSWGYNTEMNARGIHLIELFVAAHARRGGVGRALMDHVAQVCRQGGGGWVQWEVLRFDEEVKSFYQNYGGKEMAESIFMKLDLTS